MSPAGATAVASTFRADSRLFQASDDQEPGEEAEALRSMMSTIFDTTASEIAGIIDRGGVARAIDEEGIVSFLEIHASAKDLAEIQKQLHDLVKSLADRCETCGAEGAAKEGDEELRRFRLTLAYYPLDRPDREPASPEDGS